MQIVIDIPEETYNYIKANGARIPYYKLTDAIKNGTPLDDILDKIRTEIAEYKDDKVIHNERNEMIDIALEIIEKYRNEVSG